MAASSGRKTSSGNKRTTKGSGAKGTKTSARSKKADASRTAQDRALFHEIGLIVLFAAMVLLFFCNFGLIGPGGDAVSGVLFGVFGLTAYAVPVLLFLAVAFWFANEGNPNMARRLTAGAVLFLMVGIICDLLHAGGGMADYSIAILYEDCRDNKAGGGILAGSVSFFLQHYIGVVGTVLVIFLCCIVCLILLTEKSLISSMKRGGSRVRELSREDAARRREQARVRHAEQEERRVRKEEEHARREEERRLKAEERENQRILRMERKVSGVMLDTVLARPEEAVPRRDDIHEIVLDEAYSDASYSDASEAEETEGFYEPQEMGENTLPEGLPLVEHSREQRRRVRQAEPAEDKSSSGERGMRELKAPEESAPPIRIHKENRREEAGASEGMQQAAKPVEEKRQTVLSQKGAADSGSGEPKPYRFPPLTLLHKGTAATGDSERELRETAVRLQQTLATFGVKVTVTDISQGPSITRYELQPEQGVKVSKIVGLADDIKLNLAATDIRIEAPIPGKAAVGIEVPNKESIPVMLRDLLEAREFRDFSSKIAFAVGKDIAGKVVVSDIAKMPHMLIAGATGSGKSVCINTLIMSILYKAHPDDVKLIMVDPKVVELSIYNGIPHLLVPVVTDPKKASGALHWGVAEMEDRYKKFADFNVRDLAGYNKKVAAMQEEGAENAPKKLPQIVIIVDELADLMMVCPGEVEESICRLAQLARACGIHLIIATQRPSVDVITGLIKANMPSRAAFAVSSGVDSRTILDMVGAEKLLGKGDMLFYPQGYPKPARIQGAFVSDGEVSDVVDFLKNQVLGNTYAEEIEEKIKNMEGGGGAGGESSGGADVDELFERAGRLIIDKDKASIGMLQRALQIGFNRAARIMDQLCGYGVVGEEEGTKPRKILMSSEEFEQLLEELP